MKYDIEESLQALSERIHRLRRKRRRQTVGVLSAASLALFAGLVSAVNGAAGQLGTGNSVSVFGAFILPDTAGGYILAGVVAFVLGAALTLVCLRYKKRTSEITENKETPANEEENDEE